MSFSAKNVAVYLTSTFFFRMNIFKKKKQFDGENFINKNGVQMIKNIAKSYQVKIYQVSGQN